MLNHIAVSAIFLGTCLWGQDPATGGQEFVRTNGADLIRGDTPYRAIGFYMPYAFGILSGRMKGDVPERDALEKTPEQVTRKIALAAASGLAFVRFDVDPPGSDTDAHQYWMAMEVLMSTCRRCDLKVIPSIHVFPRQFQKNTGEHLQAAFDPNSKTSTMTSKFLSQVLSRYRDDTNVLMWEIGNEFAGSGLMGDDDHLAYADILRFFAQTCEFIRKMDHNHVIFIGNTMCSDAILRQRLGISRPVIGMDTAKPFEEALSRSKLLDGSSLVDTGPDLPLRRMAGHINGGERTIDRVSLVRQVSMPILVQQLGFSIGPKDNRQDIPDDWTMWMIDRLEAADANLIELLDWDFAGPSEVMSRVVDFNNEYGSLPASYKHDSSTF